MTTPTVTWAGISIITAIQGVWEFTPDLMPSIFKFDRPVRSIGELSKHLGGGGCDHSLRVIYLGVEAGTAAGKVMDFFGDLQDLLCPATGTPLAGSLIVPDYGTWPHCVMTDCSPGTLTPRAVLNTSIGSGPYNKTVYDLEFSMSFHQTRR